MFWPILWILVAAPPAVPSDTVPPAPDVLVVCPAEFRPALAPWESHRREQGHLLAVIEPPATANELHAEIRSAAAQGRLRFVLLVGDVPDAHTAAHATASRRSFRNRSFPLRASSPTVPTAYVDARVNIRWGSEPTIATDQVFADVDGDALPDVAVGRIPADTPDELSAVVRKILNYEQQADRGLWRRRVDVVAGIGGFGAVTDAVVEAAARGVFQQMLPDSYDVGQTIANPTSRYWPLTAYGESPWRPEQFTDYICRQLSAGSFAWIYLGHGLATQLDVIAAPGGGERPILSVDDLPQLQGGANSPLAVLIACYTGAVDAADDCLAEKLLAHEPGPVAVIAATRVTMPYGNAVFGSELMRACFGDRPTTLGEIWLQAARRTLDDEPNDPIRISLDALAHAFSPPPVDLSAERREHVLLYQLLGDPLLRLEYPRELHLAPLPEGVPGGVLSIDGHSDVAGDCFVELVSVDGAAGSQRVVATAIQAVVAGPFRVALTLPPEATGRFTLRAFVAGHTEFAAGSTSVIIK